MSKIKSFIQLFVPPVYYKVKKRLFPKKEPKIYPLSKLKPEGDKLIIIGNGPSLNQTMELYGDVICSTPCIMVNFSARTPLFEQIKPTYYLLADPGFIENKALSNSINALVNDIRDKTTWPMSIVMPDSLLPWEGCSELKKNNNISILFYNNRWCNIPENKLYEALDANIVGPPAQSVLNTAVWLSIYWGYKETYLVGADTSFLEETHVDQQDNRVYTEDSHFYKSDSVYEEKEIWKHNRRYLPVKYHEEIETIYIILKSYWDLKEYANWKGVKVYNASEYSCIDAFERKKLK